MGRRLHDLTGKTFGQWSVISRAPSKTYGHVIQTRYNCECTCGKKTVIAAAALKLGKSTKCIKCAGVARRGVNYRKVDRSETFKMILEALDRIEQKLGKIDTSKKR